MTSEQVMLTFAVLLGVALGGCGGSRVRTAEPLDSPYAQRTVWAVAPLRNESGSLHADGVRMADHVAQQLQQASNIDVLPVNRTLRAMDALGMGQVATKQDAFRLLQTLGADGIVVGTISAYDPYDPPTLGLAVELYLHPGRHHRQPPLDVRELTRAARDELTLPSPPADDQPAVAVAAILDARSPEVRESLKRYARERGAMRTNEAAVHYRINMDLYSEYVSYVMCWRLLRAEADRVTSLAQVEPPQ